MFWRVERPGRDDLPQDPPRPPTPYSPAEAAAVLEMQQKIYFYGWCIDHRDFAALDALFLPDSVVHYDVPGGTRLPWREMRDWLPQGLPIFRVTQHNMSNPLFELEGERARSRTYGDLLHVQEQRRIAGKVYFLTLDRKQETCRVPTIGTVRQLRTVMS